MFVYCSTQIVGTGTEQLDEPLYIYIYVSYIGRRQVRNRPKLWFFFFCGLWSLQLDMYCSFDRSQVLELRQLIKEELLGQLRTAASPLTSSHLEEREIRE